MKKLVMALTTVGVLSVAGSAFADTQTIPNVGTISYTQPGTNGGSVQFDSDSSSPLDVHLGVNVINQ